MALIDSLNPAVAGLQIQQRQIEVVGDNIANVSTPSYKAARVEFSTVFSQVLNFGAAPEGAFGGIDPVQIGKGAKVATISRDFSQGAVKSTGISSDLAVDGDGFFVVRDSAGQDLYTRDGSFSLSASNQLIDPASGAIVQGWLADEDFNVAVGGPLEDIVIPTGFLTIARTTSMASLQGILNSSGETAGSGTWQYSLDLYDAGSPNQDLISAHNPLGLERATASTALSDLVVSLGDFTSYSATSPGVAGTGTPLFADLQDNPSGTAIAFDFSKGDRRLSTPPFVVGLAPPAGGSTLGDLAEFIGNRFGVTSGLVDGVEAATNTYSHARQSPITGDPVAGTIRVADSVSLSAITIDGGDLRGVQAGDFLRFTSGSSSGQVAEILSVTDSDADGLPDTMNLRSDEFNALTQVPQEGDTFSVHASAGVRLAQDSRVSTLDGADFAASSPVVNGGMTSFTITGNVTDFVDEHGVALDQLVEFTTGAGTTARGWITAFSADSLTVSYDSALGAQTPAAGTDFEILARPPGSIEIAGNAGAANGIRGIETTAGGEMVSLFNTTALAEATGESGTTTFTVFDSLGAPHEVEMTFVYESASANGPNVVRYFAESSDDTDASRVIGNGTIIFNSQGQYLATGRSSETIALSLEPTSQSTQGVTTPMRFEADFSRLSLLSAQGTTVQLQSQDGFPAGTLREFSIGEDGVINGIFDNGLSRSLGQVALARFQNPNGLILVGDNQFQPSSNSGTPQVGEAGTLGRGRVRGFSLEDSNVNLADQFVQLLTGQRAFQANARTFSASDQLLQELVNLI